MNVLPLLAGYHLSWLPTLREETRDVLLARAAEIGLSEYDLRALRDRMPPEWEESVTVQGPEDPPVYFRPSVPVVAWLAEGETATGGGDPSDDVDVWTELAAVESAGRQFALAYPQDGLPRPTLSVAVQVPVRHDVDVLAGMLPVAVEAEDFTWIPLTGNGCLLGYRGLGYDREFRCALAGCDDCGEPEKAVDDESLLSSYWCYCGGS
jgi:hypothetical protein